MEAAVGKTKALLARAKSAKVLGRLGDNVGAELVVEREIKRR